MAVNMSKDAPAGSPSGKVKHPAGLRVLFLTEMWERFGFYLMLGILFLYMTDQLKGGLGFGDSSANDIYGTYLALVYLTPFVGGLLADRIFGYRKTIIAGGALMAMGYLTLAVPGEMAFYIALGLIIIGNGLFKPNISTLLGNLYNKPQYSAMKDKGYNIFYMGINIGAFICNFVAAWLRNEFGWGFAFAAAGIGMIIGLVIFITGSKHIREADIKKASTAADMPMSRIMLTIFVPAIAFAVLGAFIGGLLGIGNIFGSVSNDAFLFACIPVTYFYLSTYLKASSEDKKPIGSLLYIYAVVIIFWAIFHQNGNVLTGWAQSNTWRTMPENLIGVGHTLGMVEEVDAVPSCVESSKVKEGETIRDVTTLFILKDVAPAKADSMMAVLAADSTLQVKIDRIDSKPGAAKATSTLAVNVPSRLEGKHLADQFLSKGYFKALTYNDYLNTLPKDQWPADGEHASLISTELFQSINPFFVVLLTPLVLGFFGFMTSRGKGFSTPTKIALGLFVTGLSTLVMIMAVNASDNGANKVSMLWLIGTYAVITAGELCLSPMGLSLVSKLSPQRLTAVMMGGWFLSTSIGNKLAGVLGHLGSDSDNKSVVFFINFGGAMLSAFLLFLMVKRIRQVLKDKTGEI
jgi:POT family proton-dependent oligopeptide transporter